MLINFFSETISIYKLLPETCLILSIIFLIIYNCFLGEQFSHICSVLLLLYSIIILCIALFCLISVYKFNLFTNNENDFIIFNYKICFVKTFVLIISKICLILFRYSLTEKSETSCIYYFIFYLVNTTVCLISLSINTIYLHYLLFSLEILVVSLYILSSFNYNNFGYLKFRPVYPKKLFYVSFCLSMTGLILFELHFHIWNYALLNQMKSSSYYSILAMNNKYVLLMSVLCIILSLLLKLTLYYFPTYYIYYKKTPLITIIYMHLVPKIIFFYLVIELIFTNFYFNGLQNYFALLLLSISLLSLIIGIGMRRLFLKHFLENFAIINTGYLLLCLMPLTLKSLNYCAHFFYYYVLIILFYGGIASFIDNELNPGKRISFDVILSDIEKKDYLTIVGLLIVFIFFGMPPTRRDYPCSRGIPFNGFFLQWLVLSSLLSSHYYLISFFLIVFNFILFLFFVWTILPFWFERKHLKLYFFPKYFNIFVFEFSIFYFIFVLLTLSISINSLIMSFIKLYYIYI